jgi:tetratricopeptide (TPR) repeat protein
MSTLVTIAAAARDRIVAEVEAVLWHDHADLKHLGRERLQLAVGSLLDALVDRVSLADSPRLHLLTRDLLARRELPPVILFGTLIRLAAAMRSVLFLEVENRRALSIASLALDRAVAEVIEAMRSAVTTPEIASPRAPAPVRDPTMIRNIREMLAETVGEAMTASLVAVALRRPASALEQIPWTERDSIRARARQLLLDAGGQILVDSPPLIAASIVNRVNDSDALEALGLALNMQRLADLGACGFGVARGPILVSPSAEGPPHGAVGEAIARALSLASAANQGVILADAAVHALAGSTYALRPVNATLPAFRLDPDQPQWLDRWEQAALVSEPRFVGQERALRKLKTALRSPSRKVTLVGVRGRPGSGRYRLLTSALAGLDIPTSRTIVGEPHPLTPAPYWPIVSLVRQVLALEDGPVREAAIGHALESLAGRSASALPLNSLVSMTGALLGAEEADESLADVVDPQTLRLELGKTARQIIEAAADETPDRPYAIILRDVEALDVPSMHTILHLVQSYNAAAQLIVALCYRNRFKPPTTLKEAGLVEVQVEPLTDGDALDIATSMLDQEELPPEVRRLVRERSHAGPMMVSTLVRYLVEAGALNHRDGSWRPAAPLKPTDLPRRPSDVLARRIERLPAQLATLLKSAAAVGEPLSRRTLELLWVSHGVAHDEITRSLGVLEELGFLQRDPSGALRFAHPLVRQVAYDLQTEAERRESHRLAVVAYQERYPDAIRQIPAVLFRHRVESGDVVGAQAAAVFAVRRAHLLHDYKRGLEIAREAMRLPVDESRDAQEGRFDLLAALERIHDSGGDRDEQKTVIKEMVTIAEKLKHDARLGVALHRAARLNLLTGDLSRAKSLAAKALTRLRNGDPLDLSNALRTLALIRWHERDPQEAAAALNEALTIYERLGHRRGMGFVLHNLGLFALDSGAVDVARRHFERALVLKDEAEDEYGRAVVLDALGQVALLEADSSLAAARFREALVLREKAGDLAGAAQTRVNLAQAIAAASPAEADELLRAAIKACRTRRQQATKIEAYMTLAGILLATGDKAAAGRAAMVAGKIAAKVGSQLLSLRARLVRAEIDLTFKSRERSTRASALASEAARIAFDLGAVRWRIEALSLAAVAHHRLQSPEAISEAQEALQLLDERGSAGLSPGVVEGRCREALSVVQ